MRVKALVGIGYMEGELLGGVNRHTVRIKFELPDKKPFIIKRHLVKHRVVEVGEDGQEKPIWRENGR